MFEVITPFGLNAVLECLKIAFFFALGYSVGAFVCSLLVNLLFFKERDKDEKGCCKTL